MSIDTSVSVWHQFMFVCIGLCHIQCLFVCALRHFMQIYVHIQYVVSCLSMLVCLFFLPTCVFSVSSYVLDEQLIQTVKINDVADSGQYRVCRRAVRQRVWSPWALQTRAYPSLLPVTMCHWSNLMPVTTL